MAIITACRVSHMREEEEEASQEVTARFLYPLSSPGPPPIHFSIILNQRKMKSYLSRAELPRYAEERARTASAAGIEISSKWNAAPKIAQPCVLLLKIHFTPQAVKATLLNLEARGGANPVSPR